MDEKKSTGQIIYPEEQLTRFEEGDFSSVLIRGDDSLSAFLERGGASTVGELHSFILSCMDEDEIRAIADGLTGIPGAGGCSVCSVKGAFGGRLFGRNFDFRRSNLMIVKSEPKTGYASIAAVNPDFLLLRSGEDIHAPRYEKLLRLAAVYLPMDGMNEKGLCAAVNKIRDEVVVDQKEEGKTDQLASTLIRTLLDRAGNAKEALEILKETNMHTASGYLVHFTIADAEGHSFCAEYIDNRLSIVESSVVTNYYLTPGDKYGIGTKQSHLRYETLSRIISKKESIKEGFSRDDLKNALAKVAKSNYPAEGELYTEWSAVYDQSDLSVCYYRREDYEKGYVFSVI